MHNQGGSMKNILKRVIQNKVLFIIVSILFLITTFGSGYIIYAVSLLNGIENVLRTIARVGIVFIWFIILFLSILVLGSRKKKKIKSIILSFGMLIYAIILIFISYHIHKAYTTVDNITTNHTTYSTSIVTRSDESANDIKSMGNGIIGRLNDEQSIDGYKLTLDIIKNEALNNEIKGYESYISILKDLYDKKIDYAFLPTSYVTMFKSIEGYEKLGTETKIIYTYDQKVKKPTNTTPKKNELTEPFTVLLMGVDSEEVDISKGSFNGDALMLITFNPKTLNTTIMSIPRDTYVPIMCFANQRKNKITHAAWYGEDCMMRTIENFTGISIDYYVKINFKGVVKLVDALGGIDVNVPIGFCEQNSDRLFGDKTICVKAGAQTLNGEQALAWSRHRKSEGFNDFVRGQNQQEVVKGILNKAKTIRSLDTVYRLLDTIGKSMETNMTTNEILSLYNVGKDILLKSKDIPAEELLSMQRLYISGYDYYIYDYSSIDGAGTGLSLYNFVPFEGSLHDVSEAMKVNLEITNNNPIKSFYFDIDDVYEETVIGKGYYNEGRLILLPSFLGQKEEDAKSFLASYGIKVTVKNVTSKVVGSFVGQIIDQSLPAGMDIDFVSKSKGITITVVDKIETPTGDEVSEEKALCSLEENKENSLCKLPDFVGKTIDEVLAWDKRYDLFIFNLVEIKGNDERYEKEKAGKVIRVDVNADTPVFDLI